MPFIINYNLQRSQDSWDQHMHSKSNEPISDCIVTIYTYHKHD